MFSQYISSIEYKKGHVESIKFDWLLETRPLLSLIRKTPVDLAMRWIDRYSVNENLSAEWALVGCIEEHLGIEVSLRVQALRTIFAEQQRILWGFSYLSRVFQTLEDSFRQQICLQVVEEVLYYQDLLMGGRCLPQGFCVGGVRRDLSIGELDKLKNFIGWVKQRRSLIFEDFNKEDAIHDRLKRGLNLSRQLMMKIGITGPLSQAAGIDRDIRIEAPYGAYKENPIRFYKPEQQKKNRSIDRLLAVDFQIQQSFDLVESLIRNIPEGKVKLDAAPEADFEKIRCRKTIEAPSGAMSCEISNGHIQFISTSSALSSYMDFLFTGLPCDEVDVSLASLGIDPCQMGGLE